MTKFLLAALVAAFSISSLTVFGTTANGAARLNCITPERQIAAIQRSHPGAVAHAMNAAEFEAFAKGVGLYVGDAAVWFERPAVATVYVVVFVERCRVGGGEISRQRLMALLARPEV